MSVYLKSAGRDHAYIREGFAAGGAYVHTAIDLSDGSITQDGRGTAAVENVGDGWFRLSATVTPATGSLMYVGMNDTELTDNNYNSYTGVAGKGIYVWGAQMEKGSNLSKYEPTGATSNPPIASPLNGSQKAHLIARTTTAATYLASGGSTTKPAIAQTYTISCYARRSIGDYFALRFYEGQSAHSDATFNLRTGKVHSTSKTTYTNAEANIESVGGDWYRCSLTTLSLTGTTAQLVMSFNSNGGDVDDTDTALSEGYIWGAQIEEVQPNRYTNPEDLTGSPWSYAVTVTSGAAVNPVDGAMTATKVERNSSTNGAKREQSVPLIAGQTYIHSVYVKNIDATQSALRTWDNNNGSFLGTVHFTWGGTDSAVPTLSANGSASNATARDVGNGWWRISYEQTARSGSGLHASGIVAEITTANLGCYVYGFQMELLTLDGKPSPYVPVSRNLASQPESLNGSSWTNYNTTIAPDSLVAPDGSLTGDTITQGLGSTWPQNDGVRNIPANMLSSTLYTCSAYFHCNATNKNGIYIANYANSPTQVASIYLNWSGGSPSFDSSTNVHHHSVTDAGNGWHRLSFTFTTFSNASQSNQFYFYADRNAPSVDPIGIWGLQVELGTKNLVTHPEEFDNAAWTKVGSPVVTANADSVNINPYSEDPKTLYNSVQTVTITENVAAAPDGKFTADRIEDTSSAISGGTQYTQKNLSITPDTSTWTWSFYIMKDSNTSRFPLFAVGLYGGSIGNQHRYCWFNTSTGAVQNGSLNGQNPLTSVVVESVGDYWRLALTVTNNGENNLIYHQIYPAHATSLGGSGNGTPTGSVVFAHSQVQKGSTASAYEAKFTGAQTIKMLAPDGTETAEYFARTSATDGRSYQSLTKPAFAEEYTFSCYAKRSIGDFFTLRLQGTWPGRADAIFNLNTGAIVSSAVHGTYANVSATMVDVGSGWFRCSVTATADATTGLFPVYAFNSNGVQAQSADSVSNSSGYVWGAQVERGPLTDYEEASNYIAITNKATRYEPFDQGVAATFGGGGYGDRSPHILGGGGGGGSGGSVSGHNSQQDGETGECSPGQSYAGGAGGAGAGPSAAVAGGAGANVAGDGGSGGTYGAAGSSGGGGNGSAGSPCTVTNGAGGAGGAAGKAIHLISGATLTLRNNGDVMGATS
jgi:hypothetical protein